MKPMCPSENTPVKPLARFSATARMIYMPRLMKMPCHKLLPDDSNPTIITIKPPNKIRKPLRCRLDFKVCAWVIATAALRGQLYRGYHPDARAVARLRRRKQTHPGSC